jgi:hypothetical protein
VLTTAGAMEQQKTRYYACWVRWEQQDGFLLWQDPPAPARESVWADKQQLIPLFKSQLALADLVQRLGYPVVPKLPQLINLDVVAEWLKNSKKRPPFECLDTWNLFDDVGAGVGGCFAGNHKTPLRNQVFDLLYADSGPWQRPTTVRWPPAEQALLCDLLTQGFELWQKHVCWQA